MSKSKYLFLLFICLSASISIRAQFMDYGSDPARFKWNIVRLPHYNLVYPQGTDSMAYHYALYLENAYYGKFTTPSFLWTYKGGTFTGQGFDDYMKIFAIPSSELASNPELHQNPGYGNATDK